MSTLIIIVLLILTLSLLLSSKSYFSIPVYELKRRSRSNDKLSKTLYSVASYQNSYKLLNNLLILILSSATYLLIIRHHKYYWAFIFVFIYTFVIFFWLPRRKSGKISNYFATLLAKPLKFVLHYTDPISIKLFKASKTYQRYTHTGIFEEADIYHLIEQQKTQNDSRLKGYQLDVIKSVLDFNKLLVLDLMTPKRKVKSISADDSLGPIVLTELHDSGHHYFPVHQDKESNIVGTLNAELIAEGRDTKISKLMDPKVIYVNEEQEVGEVLQMMTTTGRHLFIVLNDNGDYSGIITSRDILKALMGESIIDDLDSYEDKETVSAKTKTEKLEE
jgi:CBS domain containing-hemolysin-like protein